MPTAKSGLAAKLGKKGVSAVKSHAKDETDFGMQSDLPSGIQNGVAKLVDCRFDTYKKGLLQGNYFFLARAVILAPKTVNVDGQAVKIEGRSTMIMEPCCDTLDRQGEKARKTVAEHIEWILNEMRKLGADTSACTDPSQLETIAAALKKAGPTTGFRTWGGEEYEDANGNTKQGRVNEVWTGAVNEDGTSSESDDGVEDDTATTTVEDDDDAVTTEEPSDDAPDFAALGAAADAGDDEAAIQLADLAEAAGIDSNAAPDWTSVANDLIASGGGDDAESESRGDDDDEPADPAPGELYGYQSPRMKKVAEFTVVSVDADAQTCVLKNVKTKKETKNVSWNDLQPL